MPYSEFSLCTKDQLTLQGRCWTPDAGIKAAVLLVHGLGEHSGRYDHVADAFNNSGYALVAFDLRGHGRSEGMRGHTPGFDVLLDDIFQALEKTAAQFPGLPLFLFGHSLGGNLALIFALKRKPEIAGLIASAPLLRLAFRPPKGQLLLLKALKALHIHLPISNGLDIRNISRDINVVRTYRNDPLTHDRITPPMATGMLESGEWILEHAAELDLPLLLIHGESDHITSPEATQEFAARTTCDCTLKMFKGLYHEPHNEPEKQMVLDGILKWLNECS